MMRTAKGKTAFEGVRLPFRFTGHVKHIAGKTYLVVDWTWGARSGGSIHEVDGRQYMTIEEFVTHLRWRVGKSKGAM